MRASVYRVTKSGGQTVMPAPDILARVSDWGTLRAARAEAVRLDRTITVGRYVAGPARLDGYPVTALWPAKH